jgi:ketosteroid isomerase-like protein
MNPLTRDEVEQLVHNMYDGFDVHAVQEVMLSYLADDGLEMRFPEATLRGHREFATWYDGIVHTYFDEVHTLDKLEIQVASDGSQATASLLGKWEASRWNAPLPKSERLRMQADQTWTIVRSPETGKPVILTYIVNSLTPLSGSVAL